MITLVAISGLGVLCLILEILDLRKILIPVTLIGLACALGLTVAEFNGTSLFNIESHNMIVSTGFSQGFSILFILLACLLIIMSSKFYEDKITKIADYVSLKIFLLAGAVAMVSFGNLAMFFIGVEILSIAGYVLASSSPLNLKSNEAGMKYFIMGAFASSFILFGIALVYGAIGSFDTVVISQTLLSQAGLASSIWMQVGFLMIVVGLLFKASVVPFHFWAPDVYEGSPTLVTALMSTLVKVAAIATLFKVVSIMSVLMTTPIQILVMTLSILSMVVGNITALKQTNLKRIMAYSGISHAGFMMMDLVANGSTGNATLYYATAYTTASIAAFAVILATCQDKENEDVSNIYGLVKKSPLLATMMTCAMLSLGGIPVFAGFFGKMFMFSGVFQANHVVLVLVGIICSIVAIYYYFTTASVMFTKNADNATIVFKAPKAYTVVAVIAIVLNLVIGIFPSLIMNLSL